jgi:hypothetical protein
MGRRLRWLAVIQIVFGLMPLICTMPLVGCREVSSPHGGKLSQGLVLRFKPEVARTYRYAYSVNLQKETFGRPANERIDVILLMEVLSNEADRYCVRMDVQFGGGNVDKGWAERKDEKAAKLGDLHVSDRYVFDREGTQNLCLPDGPVAPEATWEGECLFRFGDLSTIVAPMVKVRYRLVNVEQRKDDRRCTIECRPIDKEIEVPLQIGQLGLQCDDRGRVVAVRENSGADRRIDVGDIVIGIGTKQATTPAERNKLYELFIEPPNDVGAGVTLRILREGREQNVVVNKSSVTLGACRAAICEASRTVVFSADKGLVISDVSTAVYSVVYDFSGALPFVDDYSGSASIARGTRKPPPARIYRYRCQTSLIREKPE